MRQCIGYKQTGTSDGRMVLPNFIICGTQRGGTTALYHYLKMHPEVYMSVKKEVHFFDLNFHRGVEWYSRFFSGARYGSYKAVGEASPLYMYLEEVPERIHSLLPEAKLIFILRHPVDRAYSHYWHEVKLGFEHLSFEEAVEREEERLKAGSLFARQHYSYLDRGRYAAQLERYRKYFSKDQMLILINRDLRENTLATLQKVSEFLGIDPGFWANVSLEKRYNVGKSPRSWAIHRIGVKIAYKVGPKTTLGTTIRRLLRRTNFKEGYPPMKPQTRRKLLEVFKQPSKTLEQLIQRKLDWWYR